MKKVLVLGGSGMLGHAVAEVLNLLGHDVKVTHRTIFDAEQLYADYARRDPGRHISNLLELGKDRDFVINAIGVTIPHSLKNPALTFFINGALPHILAKAFPGKLIHITTDCVYSGTDGGAPYDERSSKSPVDIYGLSKSLGEPYSCLTLRTSIIGREVHGYTGLLEWFLQQKGKTVNGFTNHFWNGITTYEFANVCDKLMHLPSFPQGVYHVFGDKVSKYEMLVAFRSHFGVDCAITPVDAPQAVDRSLTTLSALNHSLMIPSFYDMVEQIPV